jgi:YtxH-like protein
MSKQAEDDMNAIKDLKLDDVLDDLRAEASKRIDSLISEGRKQARSAGGGHDDTALFSAFTLGILAGAVVGAAIALLLTPFSGTQARAKLSEKVEKLRSDQVSWDTTAQSGNGKATGTYEPTYTSPKPVS